MNSCNLLLFLDALQLQSDRVSQLFNYELTYFKIPLKKRKMRDLDSISSAWNILRFSWKVYRFLVLSLSVCIRCAGLSMIIQFFYAYSSKCKIPILSVYSIFTCDHFNLFDLPVHYISNVHVHNSPHIGPRSLTLFINTNFSSH